MSANPPSFRPEERRARPNSQAARNVAGASDAQDAKSRPLTPGEQARLDREAPAPRPAPARATPRGEHPAPSPRPSSQEAPSSTGHASSSDRPKRPSAEGAHRTDGRAEALRPGQMPVLRTRPRVYGIAADDAQARAWRVDSGEAPRESERPLLPTTADQPQRQLPPAFAPARKTPRSPAASARTAPRAGGRPRGAKAASASQRASAAPARRGRRRSGRIVKTLLVLVLALLAWAGFLIWDANQNLGRTEALSGAADTPGTTYLLAGSDSREDGAVQDDFKESERSDSIMLVNIAPNGQKTTISIPRDSYVKIPGYGWDKINASFSYGGPSLLVETVEALTGLKVDHYVQIGMGGVADIVDAVGGINVCYDGDVSGDPSRLEWTAGCHDVDGQTALAFSRMRYQDPEGDIGRAKRQRQVVSTTIEKALSPASLLNPARTLRVERAGSGSFTVDEGTSVLDIARLVLALKQAGSDGLSGFPPIEDIDYRTDAGASAVLLEDGTAPDFFAKLRSGSLTPADLNVIAQ